MHVLIATARLDEHVQRVRGLALAWPAPSQGAMLAAYVPLHDAHEAASRWPPLAQLLQQSRAEKVTWGAKPQLAALQYADAGSRLPPCTPRPPCVDARIEQWLLRPESKWVLDEDHGGQLGRASLQPLLHLTTRRACAADIAAAEAAARGGEAVRACCRQAAHALLLHCSLQRDIQVRIVVAANVATRAPLHSQAHGLRPLLMDLEMPLVPVLCAMERAGMLLDPNELCTKQLGLLERGIEVILVDYFTCVFSIIYFIIYYYFTHAA